MAGALRMQFGKNAVDERLCIVMIALSVADVNQGRAALAGCPRNLRFIAVFAEDQPCVANQAASVSGFVVPAR
jgi:hypothetical protein